MCDFVRNSTKRFGMWEKPDDMLERNQSPEWWSLPLISMTNGGDLG